MTNENVTKDMVTEKVKTVLAAFDSRKDKFAEHHISTELRKTEVKPFEYDTELLAEFIAFDFCEDYDRPEIQQRNTLFAHPWEHND